MAAKTLTRVLGSLLFVGVLAGGALAIVQGKQQQRSATPSPPSDAPVPVLAAQAQLADVPVYLEGVGTIRALNTVIVRSQVDGTLVEINFREGQDVKRGDVLAKIDPTTYRAQLDQQLAKKALDEAQLANATQDLDRYSKLIATNAVTGKQLDAQKALVIQLEAQVKLDQAAIENARAYLGYCTIVAPIDGRTGFRQIDIGNIVRASDPTSIVMLTQVQPIAAVFNIPQQHLGRINKAFAKGPLTVEAVDPDDDTVLDRGTLTVVNNQIDQATGTVQIKAQFPNAALQLWPGQFVNIRLLIDTLEQVVVVPTAALQLGPDGSFVYVVEPDATVAVRPISVARRNASQSVITGGLQASEQVVTSGFAQLADKRRVIVSNMSDPDQAIDPAGHAAGADRRQDGVRRLDAQRTRTTKATPNNTQ